MIRKLFLTGGILMFLGANAQKNFWNQVQAFELAGKSPVKQQRVHPDAYRLYHLDVQGIQSELKRATDRSMGSESLVLKFPTASGQLVDYVVQESSVMSPELAEKYSEIKSYFGYQKQNPEKTIRFSISPYNGINIMYYDGWEASYLDAYTQDNQNYIFYQRKDLGKTPGDFNCFVADDESNHRPPVTENAPFVKDGKWRNYRLAVATTVEYSQFHINRAGLGSAPIDEQRAAVLAAVTTTVTRVSGVYEKMFSVTLTLIPNEDQIIFIGTDSFSNSDPYALIDQSQTVIDSVIGFANYDVGHTFSTGAGGLAQLRVPCTSSKARGVTGTSAPVNDAYDIDYVAHELGHQFGANHTFRAATGSCAGNANNATAVEPGSGTTIMAYAGICGANNNVQQHSDPYFHSVSVNEIYNYISKPTDCSAQTDNGNGVPTADAGPDYTIPFGTAFVLTGVGSDPDGDPLTYLWEQTDNTNNTQPPVPTATAGPVFRSFLPSASPERYFPRMNDIKNNNLGPKWEMIPTVARTLNFSLVVNDNRATGNQSARDLMKVTVANAGPFKVTSQDVAATYEGGSAQTVTWDVAGTDAAPISTSEVQILLSTDGGNTYPTVLTAATPNNGSATVTLPNENYTSCRLMVKAAGNIYLAVNKAAFAITKTLGVSDIAKKGFGLYPNPTKGEVNIRLAEKGKSAYQIYDLSGRLVKTGKLEAQDNQVSVSGLKTGTYRVVVENQGKTFSQNLIIK